MALLLDLVKTSFLVYVDFYRKIGTVVKRMTKRRSSTVSESYPIYDQRLGLFACDRPNRPGRSVLSSLSLYGKLFL